MSLAAIPSIRSLYLHLHWRTSLSSLFQAYPSLSCLSLDVDDARPMSRSAGVQSDSFFLAPVVFSLNAIAAKPIVGGIFLLGPRTKNMMHIAALLVVVAHHRRVLPRAFRGGPSLRAQGPHECVQDRRRPRCHCTHLRRRLRLPLRPPSPLLPPMCDVPSSSVSLWYGQSLNTRGLFVVLEALLQESCGTAECVRCGSDANSGSRSTRSLTHGCSCSANYSDLGPRTSGSSLDSGSDSDSVSTHCRCTHFLRLTPSPPASTTQPALAVPIPTSTSRIGECATGIWTDVSFSDLYPPADNLATTIREYWEDSETESDWENGEKDNENGH
ncbi:hypothetical protein K438DRAFT_2030038 [Mycena galopus ATCC 62051]|nr:hypothetical protein K438DRAFT_2030038 [Mycena galopus ATCC 62051]